MHLGATPFSIYNTYTAEQIEYLVEDAARAIVVTEQAFLDRLAVRRRATALEHVIVVDGRPDGARRSRSSARRRASTSTPPGRPSSPTTCSR